MSDTLLGFVVIYLYIGGFVALFGLVDTAFNWLYKHNRYFRRWVRIITGATDRKSNLR